MPNMDGPPASTAGTYNEDTQKVSEADEILSQESSQSLGVVGAFFNATAQAVPVGVASYHGISVAETSGSATAQVKVYSGTGNTGDLLEIVNLAGNESTREFYPNGVAANGIYVEVTSGAAEGIIRWSE